MTINGNTIARVIDNQTLNDREVKNVYHYLLTTQTATPNLQELANEFITEVVTPMAVNQADDLRHTTVQIQLVNRGNSEIEVPVNIDGSDIGNDESPSFLAASYKLTRTDTDTRNGRKSIAGLTEADVDGNALSGGGAIKFANIAPLFVRTLNTTDGDWRPIILGKVSSEVNGTYFLNFIKSVFLRPNVSTQVSRK